MVSSITSSPSSSSSSFSALGFSTVISDDTPSAVSEKLAAGASVSIPFSSSSPSSATSSSPYSQSPRRAFSLPSKIKLPFSSPKLTSSPHIGLGLGSPMIPLHSPTRSARRFSYNLKNRASHYSLPLTIGGLFTLALFIYVSLNGSNEVSRFNNSSSRLQLYGRSRFSEEEHAYKIAHKHRPDSEPDNGVSLLVMDEEELIAEDDLYWDSYKEATPKTKEEIKAEKELKEHKADVIKQDKLQSLRALIWWLAEGGILPNDWEVPTKQYLKKIGGRGMERLLEDIDSGEEGDEIFDNGWAEFANRRYRVVVFSKSHCPYSKKAKSIFGEYHISPAPFIIELDQRSDMEKIQTLLQRITGRRTVPNVLLDFVSIGGSDDVTLLHSEGGLQRKLEDMEVLPFSRRRKTVHPPPPVVPQPPVPAPAPVEEAETNKGENVEETITNVDRLKRQTNNEVNIEAGAGESEPNLKISDEFIESLINSEIISPQTNQQGGDDSPILAPPPLLVNDIGNKRKTPPTNAERFVNKRRQAPGTGTLELTSFNERGSWKKDNGMVV